MASKNAVTQAAEDFKLHTCIRLEPKDSSHDKGHIVYYNGGGCTSRIGYNSSLVEHKVGYYSDCTNFSSMMRFILHFKYCWEYVWSTLWVRTQTSDEVSRSIRHGNGATPYYHRGYQELRHTKCHVCEWSITPDYSSTRKDFGWNDNNHDCY